jgi:hypothetical protein
MYGDATSNRFAFTQSYDTGSGKFGGYVSSFWSTQTAYNYVYYSARNSYSAATFGITDNTGSRSVSSLDSDDFEVYPLIDYFLRDSYTNPTVSSIALVPSNYVYFLDGSTNSISMSASFTRTFTNS